MTKDVDMDEVVHYLRDVADEHEKLASQLMEEAMNMEDEDNMLVILAASNRASNVAWRLRCCVDAIEYWRRQ